MLSTMICAAVHLFQLALFQSSRGKVGEETEEKGRMDGGWREQERQREEDAAGETCAVWRQQHRLCRLTVHSYVTDTVKWQTALRLFLTSTKSDLCV